jgi:hypothetical protein
MVRESRTKGNEAASSIAGQSVARTEEASSWKAAETSEEMQRTSVACYHSSVVLLKSILAGLVFLVGAAILLLLGAIVFFATVLAPEAGTAVGFDPVSFAKSSPLIWMLAVLVFLLGFSWEYRRAKARQAA